ncbi:hypothetical protein O6H91_10G083400 [Diphasiastrum complanatum]|uniref:Uncharacterized protein n=1 Tax=Diphasiastrum complanatum TaxID=34168 RepID=A0ACC2CJ10_DIPCM|nr:hypothetical protein O6H91_10G083400 [Diphasiastrum complanatum]
MEVINSVMCGWILFMGFLLHVSFAHQSVADQVPFSPKTRKLAGATDLAGCLVAAKSRVAFPGSPEYQSARTVFNRRFPYSPAAFVFPTTVPQVQNAVVCAVQLRIGISPRSGGHSYEDYSLGGRDGVLVVDLAGFKQIEYNRKAGTVKVGSGVRLGPLKLALWNLGKVTVPAGNCPTVGVGGHALGGGWGFTSRKFGMLSDIIIEVEVVTSTGGVVTANAKKNADLYWAMRGAGANSFGIVTQFTFRVHDVSAPVTHFSFSFQKSQQFQTIKAYQIWGLAAGAETSASLYLDPSGGNNFYGTFLGPSSNLNGVLSIFFANSPAPSNQAVLETDYIHTVLIDGGLSQDANPSVLNLDNYTYPTSLFKAKSIIVKAPGFSDAGIQTFVNTMQAGQVTSYFIFDLFGGSASIVNTIASGATAWVHRNSLFNIQMLSYWQFNLDQANADIAFMGKIWNAVLPFASLEAYQNYIDRDMPLSAYYGSNLNRLITIKKSWDPTNVFNFPQSIPVN